MFSSSQLNTKRNWAVKQKKDFTDDCLVGAATEEGIHACAITMLWLHMSSKKLWVFKYAVTTTNQYVRVVWIKNATSVFWSEHAAKRKLFPLQSNNKRSHITHTYIKTSPQKHPHYRSAIIITTTVTYFPPTATATATSLSLLSSSASSS